MTGRTALTTLLAVALIICISHLAEPIRRQSVTDYATYWLASSYVAQHGGSDIYSVSGEHEMHVFFRGMPLYQLFTEEFENTQSPFLYGLVYLFSTGDIIRDSRIYQAASLLIFGGALTFFLSQAKIAPWVGLLVAIYIAAYFPPFRFEVANANVNRLLLGFVALSLWSSRWRRGSGTFISWVVWGMAICFKPTVALAPFLLLCAHGIGRKGALILREILGLLCGGIGAVLLGCWFFGNYTCWLSWLGRLSRLPLSASPLDNFNFSLPNLGIATLGIDISGLSMWILLPLSILLSLWALCGGIRQRKSTHACWTGNSAFDADFRLVALGLLIYLLWAPLVWLHYYLLCLPMMVILIQRFAIHRPVRDWGTSTRSALTIAAMILLSRLPVAFLPSSKYVLLILGAMVWLGAAVLFVLGIVDAGLTLGRRKQPATPSNP